uniref:hypothetical protein n=1 Tax=Aquisphaera insulae TaxID=2712864 RepID=UPI0013EBCA26
MKSRPPVHAVFLGVCALAWVVGFTARQVRSEEYSLKGESQPEKERKGKMEDHLGHVVDLSKLSNGQLEGLLELTKAKYDRAMREREQIRKEIEAFLAYVNLFDDLRPKVPAS